MVATMGLMMKRVEFEIGDAVTPTAGALAGVAFVVVASSRELFDAEDWVKVRPAAPEPNPLGDDWIPVADFAPLYAAGRCQVCGAAVHRRCEPVPALPPVGREVRLRHALRMEAAPHELHAGARALVVELRHRMAVLEFDETMVEGTEDGVFCVADEDFFQLFEVSP